MQGVEGDHAAAQVDVLEQRAQGGGLAGSRQQRLASGRPACVTRHGLEVGAVRVAVRAADPLAVGGQRRHVRVLRETRRSPPAARPAGRPGRCPRAPGRPSSPTARPSARRRCATRPARAAPPDRGSSRTAPSPPGRTARPTAPARTPTAPSRGDACGLGRGGCRAPPRTARAANAVPRACSAPASPGTPTPDGPPGPPARPRVRAQRSHEHLLRAVVRVRVAAVVPREALRAAHPHPVRRVVARPPESRRVHERLRELQRMAVQRRPVRAQPAQAAAQRPRRQVRHARRRRQDQEPRVVGDQVQTTELHRPVPAQPAVARRALERPGLPPDQRQPVTAPHRDVAQPAARELPEAQVVVLRHQRVPAPPLVRTRRPHLHLPDDHLRSNPSAMRTL